MLTPPACALLVLSLLSGSLRVSLEAPARTAQEAKAQAAAIDAAVATRQAAPSAANWAAEGAALEAAGQLAGAAAAYGEASARETDPQARTTYEAKVLDLSARAHSEAKAGQTAPVPAVDAAAQENWGSADDSAAPLAGSSEGAPPPPVQDTGPIVKKWYFWVTVLAIGASAGAIAGIAAKSAIDAGDEDRALVLPGPTPTQGPALLRF